jgi:hypothetical protein
MPPSSRNSDIDIDIDIVYTLHKAPVYIIVIHLSPSAINVLHSTFCEQSATTSKEEQEKLFENQEDLNMCLIGPDAL